MATSLVNGLGGTAGFGESSMLRLDDSPSLFIDLTAVMPGGLNFFGTTYTGLFLNYNGSVTFGTALEEYTPTAITATSNIPIIAPFWADTDTRGGATAASPGGTSTGSNLVWYDLDDTSHTFTATWDDVGYFSQHLDKLNAFQLQLVAVGTNGDFDITFRYESINWTTGDASGGDGGLFGQVAVAGYSSGDGENFFQLEQSGNQAAMLALPTASNSSTPGLFSFSIRQGVPVVAQIAIAAASADQPEGHDGLTIYTFTVSLTGDTSIARTVSYAVTGGDGANAATDSDFENGALATGTVSFGVGDTVQTITVKVQGDAEVEADETFLVTLSNATGGAALETDEATGTIRNDDARLAIAAVAADKAEGDSGTTSFIFTVTRTGDTSIEHSASYGVTGPGNHAASASDFAGGVLPTGTVVFAAHEAVQTITIAVNGDAAAELDEEFVVGLSNASAGALIETPTATGTIRNDDPVTVSIVAQSADKPEGDGGTTIYSFTLMLDQAATTDQTVEWAVTGHGAHPADAADFGSSFSSGTIAFAAGETVKTLEISVAGDAAVEHDEGFAVGLSKQSSGLVLGTAAAAGVVRNDDRSIVSISALTGKNAEGDSGTTAFIFAVSLDQAGVADQTVVWSVAGAGPHAANGADFGGVLLGDTLTFVAGQTSKTVTVLVSGDGTVEHDEGFEVVLSNESSGLSLGVAAAGGTIKNDDKSIVSIAEAIASRPEGDSGTISYEIPIVLDQAAVTTQTVAWAVTGTGDHPADAADFNGALSGILTFAPGQASGMVTITVSGDTSVEFDESAVLTLSNSSVDLTLGTSSALGIILNDDMSIVSIAALSASKPEGDDATTLYTFAITLDRPGVVPQTISWTVSGSGTHMADGADFGGLAPSGSTSFAAGETIQILTIAVTGDTIVEPDEGFKVALSNQSSGLALGIAAATGIIQNDDSATVTIAAVTPAQAEGDGGATVFAFEISLSQAAVGGETIAWSVSGAGAHPADAGDFGDASSSGAVTFAPGQASAIVSISVSGDTMAELDESFAVELSSPSSGLTLGTSTAVATILNDDTPVVSIAGAAAIGAEGDAGTKAFTFIVSLDQAAPTDQSVDWTVTGSGAHAADVADFGGVLPTGSVILTAGETSTTVTVLVAGDTTVEHDEAFLFTLSKATSGLAIGTGSAGGTILNDDKPLVSIAAAAAAKPEGHAGTTAFTFIVSLDQAATSSQSVDWTVAGSGAHPADGADFGGSMPTGTVILAAGETSATVTALVAGDAAVELDEGFEVVLSNVSPALALGVAAANGKILNDDATVSIAALSASKAEGDSGTIELAFEVTLVGDSTVQHSVSYVVSGSGEHPADATDLSGSAFPAGTLTFGIGETSRTILVNVAGDTSFEPDESLAIALSAPSSGLTIVTGSANGMILNDDPAGPPPPTVVHNDAYVGLSGQLVQMGAANGVLFNDRGSNLVASLANGPAHGMLTVNADGGLDYTPNQGFTGTDSFRYLAMGEAGGEHRTVDIHIARLTANATLDLFSLTAEQQIAIAYVTFFGRGADAKGFRYWVDEFDAGLPHLGAAAVFSAVADAFAASAEARILFPFLDRAEGASDAEIGGFLDAVYNNLFNRSADAEGLAYWTGQVREAVAAGRFVGSILDDIVGGARNSEAGQDVMTVLGKIAVSLSYVHDQERFHAPWTAIDDAAPATALLDGVTADPQTVLVGVVQAYDLVLASLARADGFGELPGSAF